MPHRGHFAAKSGDAGGECGGRIGGCAGDARERGNETSCAACAACGGGQRSAKTSRVAGNGGWRSDKDSCSGGDRE
jgi:hypothetical protein